MSNVASYCQLTLKLADGRIWTATEPDYFECLVSIRRSLEKNDLAICCQGARRDVWASGMARDMGAGLRAYVLKEGRNASVEDLVIAAIAFHYEGPADPFLVRAIAERRDAHELASEGCVHALKRCLHLFSLALGGPGSLLYDAPSGAQEARARSPYEFKDAPRGVTRQPGGRLLMQPPPDD